MVRKLLFGTALTLLVFTAGWTATTGLTSKAEWERTQLRVLQVFSANDGNAVFRAYLVKWKDQEVIVPDTLVTTKYNVGDTATVLVMKHKHPNEKAGKDLLSFSVVPVTP